MVFDIHHVVETQIRSLTYRMVADDELLSRRLAQQMNILNMVPHM